MWHVQTGMNIVDPHAELAMRTGHGGVEIRHVLPPPLLLPGPAGAPAAAPLCMQSFEGGSPVVCMQECQTNFMCRGFVIHESVCYFKQDLDTPGGLRAAMVRALRSYGLDW